MLSFFQNNTHRKKDRENTLTQLAIEFLKATPERTEIAVKLAQLQEELAIPHIASSFTARTSYFYLKKYGLSQIHHELGEDEDSLFNQFIELLEARLPSKSDLLDQVFSEAEWLKVVCYAFKKQDMLIVQALIECKKTKGYDESLYINQMKEIVSLSSKIIKWPDLLCIACKIKNPLSIKALIRIGVSPYDYSENFQSSPRDILIQAGDNKNLIEMDDFLRIINSSQKTEGDLKKIQKIPLWETETSNNSALFWHNHLQDKGSNEEVKDRK